LSVLEQNVQRHQQAIDDAEKLFYGFNFTPKEWELPDPQTVKMSWDRYAFPMAREELSQSSSSSSSSSSSTSTSMVVDATPPVPFGKNDLAVVSKHPWLSASECDTIINEAETMGKYFGWHTVRTALQCTAPHRKVLALAMRQHP
jgi:hypothetical protein